MNINIITSMFTALNRLAMGNSTTTAMNIHKDVCLNQPIHHFTTGFHPTRTSPGTRARKARKRAAQTRGGR